jgi:NTE family protein
MTHAPTLGDWLREGPYALTLSAGFFGFFAHAGVLTVLEDEGHLPSRISGASAGALAGGAWAAGVDAPALARELLSLDRADFWDPRIGPGLLRGRLFRERLDAMLPASTFRACRVPLAVSVYDLLSRRVRPLDAGSLAPAIQASCAVPFMFHPVWIDRRPLVDGGVADRPGLAGMPDGTRVLFHHLSSRSPWRDAASMQIPKRAGMTSLTIENLPRVGPFRLPEGARAFEAARRGMRRALTQPIDRHAVRV